MYAPIDPNSLTTPPFVKPQNKGLTLEGKVTISQPGLDGSAQPQQPKPMAPNAAKKLAPPPMANLQAPPKQPVPQPQPGPVPTTPTGPMPLTAAQRLAGGGANGAGPDLSSYDNELSTLNKRRADLLAKPDPTAPTREKMHFGALPIGLALLGLLGKGAGLTRAVLAYEGGKAQGNEKHYEDALSQYNTDVTKRDAQVKELDSAVNNATTRREKAIADADLAQHRRAQEVIARQNAHTKALNVAYMHQHYQDWAQNAAQRIGVAKAGIAERYAAISAATQRALTVQGMRDDTAMFLGQLRGSIEVADTLLHDQTAQRDTDVREGGAMTRAQMADNVRLQAAAMTNMRQLINVASNPKNPGQKQAMASLQAQIADPNSPLNSVVRSMQDTGIMGASVANSIEADAEVEAGVQTGAVAPVIPGITTPPVAPVVINVPGGAAPPMSAGDAMSQGASTVQSIVDRYRHGASAGGGASAQAAPPQQHAHVEMPDAQHMSAAKQYFTSQLQQLGAPTRENVEKAWKVTAAGFKGASADSLAAIRREIVGDNGETGAPQPKNAPTIP